MKISFTRDQLEKVLNDSWHIPEEVLEVFEQDRHFQDLFSKDVGVWEKYTLGLHIVLVLKQFKKYFSSFEGPIGISRKFMEVVLVLHDIGKPEAVAAGDKRRQHEFTPKIMADVLKQLDYKKYEIDFAIALVSGDPIGPYLKGGDVSSAAEKIIAMAKQAKVPVKAFWKVLILYFQVDAGSYTKDAGGLPSLDYLFLFNPGGGKMAFVPAVQAKIDLLEQKIAELTAQP